MRPNTTTTKLMSERPIHPGHHCHREDHRQHRLGPVHDARSEHHANGIEVIGRTRHDVARAVLRIEVAREGHQTREHVVSQIELDISGYADEDHSHPVLEYALDSGQQREQAGELQNFRQRELS
jgi:hypothetical protein